MHTATDFRKCHFLRGGALAASVRMRRRISACVGDGACVGNPCVGDWCWVSVGDEGVSRQPMRRRLRRRLVLGECRRWGRVSATGMYTGKRVSTFVSVVCRVCEQLRSPTCACLDARVLPRARVPYYQNARSSKSNNFIKRPSAHFNLPAPFFSRFLSYPPSSSSSPFRAFHFRR